jgi:hypothetical protein
MKKYSLLVFLLALAAMFASCSSDDENSIEEPIELIDEPIYPQESDLYGVWSFSGSDIYYIAFTETGRYSLCFNSKLMGAGTYTLDKNTLTLTNGYLHTKDVFTIEKDGSILKMQGDMLNFKSSDKQAISAILSKTEKEIPLPKTGETFKIWGLSNNYGSIVTKIEYQSDYLIHYQYCKDNSLQQVIEEDLWYYVYCDGLTYTQDCSGNGNVVIYKLRDHYSTLKSQIVKQAN